MVNLSSTTRVAPITPPATGPVTDASAGLYNTKSSCISLIDTLLLCCAVELV